MRTDIPADCEKTQAPGLQEMAEKMRAELRQAQGRTFESAGCNQQRSAESILRELFTYHPPTIETLPKFAAINQAAKNFAEIVLQNCPSSADRSDAIRKIREARMVANAAVALDGLSL